MSMENKIREISKEHRTVEEVISALDSNLEKIYFIDKQINLNLTNQAIVCLLGNPKLAVGIQETIDRLIERKKEINAERD